MRQDLSGTGPSLAACRLGVPGLRPARFALEAVMSAEKTQLIPGFFATFDFCKAIDETGAIRSGSRGARIELPRGLELARGSFGLRVIPDDELLLFGSEWRAHEGDLAVFEPVTGELEPWQIYLWGEYDPFHRWLEVGYVDRFEGEIAGKLLFHGDDEELRSDLCPARGACVIVGRLVAILRGDPFTGYARAEAKISVPAPRRRVRRAVRLEVVEGASRPKASIVPFPSRACA